MELYSYSSHKIKETLEDAGIESDFEFDIQKTIENNIERSSLEASDIEPKLDYIVDQLSTIADESESVTLTSSPDERSLKFLINQEHNLKSCPECGAMFLKSDSYCFKCGLKLGRPDYEEELNDLEKLYDKKISHCSDNNFKFAYVIYLEYLHTNGHIIPESEIRSFNVTLERLTRKASEDGYDSIERAEDFINDNRHVIFYNSHPELKRVINVDLYEDIFENKCRSSEKNIVETIAEYLKRQYMITLSNYEISRCYNILHILSKCHEYLGNIDSVLKCNFKLFILDVNNFTEDKKRPDSCKAKINEETVDKLTKLLDENSIASNKLNYLFNSAYADIKELKPCTGVEETLIYFLRIFNGEKISDVEKSIHLKYS
ncbi:hypothetical protein [Methanobrevibacter millerae]|uniref:Uncharacterized protein n=1 Tax=Methanobrevibacter millerae TaxID=230361 RepID=A0A1G5VI05_9EURY|nr:hypothetical protein [Methanobrevibacter millerae]SDA45503.1 hypothetical protein SAMN02910315_00631 [Methanobrevibacter millerae]